MENSRGGANSRVSLCVASRNAQSSEIMLAIVKEIVDADGGRISVKTELGKGSEFSVVLSTPKEGAGE